MFSGLLQLVFTEPLVESLQVYENKYSFSVPSIFVYFFDLVTFLYTTKSTRYFIIWNLHYL